MLANDVHPNRLQRAKADILDLIKELPGDRVALVAFRRTAILLCPLTTDYAYVRQALDAVTTESAPRGETNIGDAIDKAMQAFESDEGAHKAIILISDGEDLSGTAIKAAEKAGEKNIPIFTVGIGNRRGSTIPENGNRSEPLKYRGENVVTKLNDDELYSIANKTGGAYLPVETASMGKATLGTLYRDYLRQISGRDMEETLQRRHIERYQFFLLPAVVFLLAGACLSQGRLKTGNRGQEAEGRGQKKQKAAQKGSSTGQKGAAVLIAALLTSWTGATAQTNEQQEVSSTNGLAAQTTEAPPGREGARLAQRLYLKGDYEEAAQTYLEATRSAGEGSRRDFRFNAAVALFKAGKYKEAADILKDLIQTDQGIREDVFMGLGSSLFRSADRPASESEADKATARERSLRDAGEAFKEAARIRSENNAARRNLAVVLDALPEAEEQAKTAKWMAQYGQTPTGTIANEMLLNQRKLTEEIPAAFSNASPAQIKELERLADKQRDNAELWIPLKGKLMNEMAQQPGNTNLQQQLAFLNQMVETTRDQMLGGSAALRDLDPEGYRSVQTSEKAIYQFWRAIAPYALILQEDLLRQTNIIMATSSIKEENPTPRQSARANQSEALALTRLFAERFAETVPEGGTPATAVAGGQISPPGTSTNAVGQATEDQQQGISAEDRKKILELANQTIAMQEKAEQALEKNATAVAVPHEREAYRLLKEIEKLLPKDKKQNSSESQEKKQQEQQEKRDEQKQESSSSPQQQEQQPQESQPQQKQEEKEQESKQAEQKDLAQEEAKKLIEKAMQREKEHDAEKRRMNNKYVPPSAIEKDW
jgi:hypothetical protein